MDATEPTLTDFLLARIAERLAGAGNERAHAPKNPAPWPEVTVTADAARLETPDGADITDDYRRWLDSLPLSEDALQVRRECEAMRRLIDWLAPVTGHERVPTSRPGVYDRRPLRYLNEDAEDVLRILALPYADHPDYRDEWRP